MMITLNSNKINTLNQKTYNKFLTCIDFNRLSCSCGHAACLTKHGYYTRSIKSSSTQKVMLTLLRVKCSICGKTHALFPINIVPYSGVLLEDQVTIINNYLSGKSQESLMTEKSLIDESNISYIINNYRKYWHQRFISYSISLNGTLEAISSQCIKLFLKQFMQIKWVINIFII